MPCSFVYAVHVISLRIKSTGEWELFWRLLGVQLFQNQSARGLSWMSILQALIFLGFVSKINFDIFQNIFFCKDGSNLLHIVWLKFLINKCTSTANWYTIFSSNHLSSNFIYFMNLWWVSFKSDVYFYPQAVYLQNRKSIYQRTVVSLPTTMLVTARISKSFLQAMWGLSFPYCGNSILWQI